MADEIEDPTGVTRRSQEPTNKQTPIIKGVLPDAPAPQAAPRPVAPAQPPVEQAAPLRGAAANHAKSPVPAEKGFFGWIKGLFGGEAPAPVKPVQPAAAPKPAEGRDGRSRDGGRPGGKPGEGRPEGRSDGRGPRGEGRGRGGRGGRGGSGADRQAGAQRERFDAEGKPMLADANLQGANAAAQEPTRQEQRPDRGPRTERGNRSGRGGERNEAGERSEPRADGRAEGPSAAADGSTENRNTDGPTREPREPREVRGGRGGRNGRGPRPDSEGRSASGEGRQSQLGFADGDNTANQAPDDQPAPADDNGSAAPRNENGEPREKRNRDRYGRERGPRGEREERPDLRIPAQPAAAQAGEAEAAPVSDPVQVPAPRMADVAAPAAAPVAPAAVAPAAAAPSARMPKVTSFALPTDALLSVANGSGLQWVNSDSDKVAAVQAAIAAESKPIHVPRERPAAVSVDAGPLVLVETKRDLRNMTLPFEQTPAA
jgi:ribonuclease E